MPLWYHENPMDLSLMKRTVQVHTSRVSPTAKCSDIYTALSLRWQRGNCGGGTEKPHWAGVSTRTFYVVHQFFVGEKNWQLDRRECVCVLVDILLLHCCCNCNSSAKSLISFRPALANPELKPQKSRHFFAVVAFRAAGFIMWLPGTRTHCPSFQLMTHLMKVFLCRKSLGVTLLNRARCLWYLWIYCQIENGKYLLQISIWCI